MANQLADDAAALIKRAQEYTTVGPIRWDSIMRMHLVTVGTGQCSVADLAGVLRGDRELIITDIIAHLLRECSQTEYGGGHGSRNTYVKGCRGLLCRRAQREEMREAAGQQPSKRFAVPDELLDEAQARIKPEEVIGHIRFSDRVAVKAS